MNLREAFLWAIHNTQCPFADETTVQLSTDWTDRTYAENIRRIARELITFCKRCIPERLPGFALLIDDPSVDSSHLTQLSHAFRRTLLQLEASNPGRTADLRAAENKDWQWEFADVRLLLNVFAPCYPPGHPEHLPTDSGFVILAQPSQAFEWYNAGPDNRRLKTAIRRRFSEAGRPYDGELIDRGIDALHYIFPIRIGGPIVYWFREDGQDSHDDG